MQLAGRVALVTGAGSGIGRATAILLAQQGAVIGALGRSADELEAAGRQIEAAGGRCHVLKADVSRQDEMVAAVERLVGAEGRLDIVVANAGINGVWAPIDDLKPAEWDETIAGATAYSATKAAQVAMVQQLALELGKAHIRINAVCPGAIETNIDDNTDRRYTDETEIPVIWPEGDIPITDGTPGTAGDVAAAILFLVSPASRHITGTPLWIDGGQGLLR